MATSRTSALATSASGGHKAPPGQGQLHGRAAWAVAQGSGLGAAPSWAACEPPRASGDADSLLNEASRLHFAPGPWIPSLVLCPGNRTRTSGSGPAPSSASATCAAPHVRSERGRAADRPGGEGHAVANVGVPPPPTLMQPQGDQENAQAVGAEAGPVDLRRGSASGPGRRRDPGRWTRPSVQKPPA